MGPEARSGPGVWQSSPDPAGVPFPFGPQTADGTVATLLPYARPASRPPPASPPSGQARRKPDAGQHRSYTTTTPASGPHARMPEAITAQPAAYSPGRGVTIRADDVMSHCPGA